jgi:hypothetical protein
MTVGLVSSKEVKKHVGAVHIAAKLSLLQRKLYNVLLFNSYDHLLTRERHDIRIRELCDLAGFDSNNHQVLKDTLVSLAKIQVQWNILDEDGEEVWGVSSMIAEAVIRKGVCSYAYAPSLREKLYNPAVFARINLGVMGKFSSTYSLALYENAVRYRAVHSTGWHEVSVWRKLLGVQEDEYRQFKELNKKVLKPAIAEINANSDILLEMEFQRERQRISAIRFRIRDNPQLPIPFPIKERLFQHLQEAPASSGTPELLARLGAYGLTGPQARRVIGEHDAAYIDGVLAIVERDFRAGKVENLAAYTLAALKADYRPKPAPRQLARTAARAARHEQQDLAEQAVAERDREAQAARQALKDALDALPPARRQALRAEFVAAIDAGSLPGAKVLKEQYESAGFDSFIVQSMFFGFARERLLPQAA